MKKLIALLILGVVVQGFAQKAKDAVPQSVKDAFVKAYPNAKGVKWSKEESDFEASFNQNKEEMSVVLDASGNVKEVETEIAQSALPEAIKSVLTKEYKDYKVTEAAKITAGGVTSYEAEVKKGKEEFDFIFSADGKLQKKVEKKKEEKDKD
ncbi:hypothetical protein WSM22_35510 [Cytophagales bacterium WSM2-2]|nr:hypothetical protein WSM22_35510 [Cytophagales bacterium WSM2-2]